MLRWTEIQAKMPLLLPMITRVQCGLLNHLAWTHMAKGNSSYFLIPNWWCCFKVLPTFMAYVFCSQQGSSPVGVLLFWAIWEDLTQMMYFFDLEVYRREGILWAEVFERAVKTAIKLFKWPFQNVLNKLTLWPSHQGILRGFSLHCAYCRYVKGMPLSVEGIWKGDLFCPKWYRKS